MPSDVVTTLEVNEEGVVVVVRPSASVVTTPTADVAVVSVDVTDRELDDEGVTNRVDVLEPQRQRVSCSFAFRLLLTRSCASHTGDATPRCGVV